MPQRMTAAVLGVTTIAGLLAFTPPVHAAQNISAPASAGEPSVIPPDYEPYRIRLAAEPNTYLRAITFASPKRTVHGKRNPKLTSRQYTWYLPPSPNGWELGDPIKIRHAYVLNGCMDVNTLTAGSVIKVNPCDAVRQRTQFWRPVRTLHAYALYNTEARLYVTVDQHSSLGQGLARLQPYDNRLDIVTRQQFLFERI
jgi:hypothetical protein